MTGWGIEFVCFISQITMVNKRDNGLDNISGLLIIYMIFGHFCGFCGLGGVFDYVFLRMLEILMFWFFFKSGMFYREREIKDVVSGGVKSSLFRLPYLQ